MWGQIAGGIAAAAEIAFIGTSLFETALAYRRLPASIPLHFDIRGKPDGYYPRPMAWFTPLLGAGVVVLVAFGPATHPDPAPWIKPAIGVGTAWLICGVQRGIIAVSLGRSQRLNPRVIFVPLVAIFAAVGLAIAFAK